MSKIDTSVVGECFIFILVYLNLIDFLCGVVLYLILNNYQALKLKTYFDKHFFSSGSLKFIIILTTYFLFLIPF